VISRRRFDAITLLLLRVMHFTLKMPHAAFDDYADFSPAYATPFRLLIAACPP